MKKLALILLGLITLSNVSLWIYNNSHKAVNNQTLTQQQVTGSNPPVSSASLTATTDYKIIVGANPGVGKKQTFSPPANSVAITNEAQLRELIAQAQSRSKRRVN